MSCDTESQQLVMFGSWSTRSYSTAGLTEPLSYALIGAGSVVGAWNTKPQFRDMLCTSDPCITSQAVFVRWTYSKLMCIHICNALDTKSTDTGLAQL